MKFDSTYFGAQGLTCADEGYTGTTYSEVREAMFRNVYYRTWGSEDEPPLPTYEVTLGRVLRGILPRFTPWHFKEASARALDARSDLRWGEGGRGYRRLLHPNGVCLFGRWIIDQPNEYSGYFKSGSEALIIGRYSTCCTETRQGYSRSLSLVGKLYPTTNRNHSDPLQTANFITQEDLGGSYSSSINEVVLRNAPDTTPWRRQWALPVLLVTGATFLLVDKMPTIRQVYPIAELDKPASEPTKAPAFMQLKVADTQPRMGADGLDFREEVLSQIYDRGDPVPKRKLVFTIEVTDDGYTRGKLVQRRYFNGWKSIGRIEFEEAVASYNGDFVIHFNHPKWREDQNKPRSVFRKGPGS